MMDAYYGDADCHYIGAFTAAVINFPVWRATTICQLIEVEGASSFQKFVNALSRPPFRGTFATLFGMTWSRGTIFYGSDFGKQYMKDNGFSGPITSIIPPLVVSAVVQVLNTPLLFGTIALQNPHTIENSVLDYVENIVKEYGYRGLFGGAIPGIIRNSPKYAAIVAINDYLDEELPLLLRSYFPDIARDGTLADGSSRLEITTLAVKSVAAGVGGAVLTNPIDVIHGECLRLGSSNPVRAVGSLLQTQGPLFFARGVLGSVVSVALPVSITIYVSDVMKKWKYAEEF